VSLHESLVKLMFGSRILDPGEVVKAVSALTEARTKERGVLQERDAGLRRTRLDNRLGSQFAMHRLPSVLPTRPWPLPAPR